MDDEIMPHARDFVPFAEFAHELSANLGLRIAFESAAHQAVLFGLGGWELGDLTVAQQKRDFLFAPSERRSFSCALRASANQRFSGEGG
jgi:hypothetical protein